MKSIDINAEIERRNALFNRASKAQQRVLIAQDVIDQLKAKRLVATRGVWVKPHYNAAKVAIGIFSNRPLAEVSVREAYLDKRITSCQTCGIGSLLASCVLFKNEVTTEEVGYALNFMTLWKHKHKDKLGLRDLFGLSQLQQIELAFELGRGMFVLPTARDAELRTLTTLKLKVAQRAIAFGRRYKKVGDRLLAIMRNIVRNKGTFQP